MYCQECGTEVSDEANYCPSCGRPQKVGVVRAATEIYEICQTSYQIKKRSSFFRPAEAVFVALAVCPKKGNYTAAESQLFLTCSFPCRSDEAPQADFSRGVQYAPQREAAFDALTQLLVEEGWEPVSQSELFRHQHRFRRRL
ncbi:zinc ribbon domain-containing protein [Longimicrobium terrae]|uniref:zinc ribbon domain-containing protein n=1 Tax=Longimicrobium terrae TaxID=1639882 RepID=UPI0014740331|nr:zinc ribbon domain-containing protein [Longimicrobium terrae]